MADPENAPPPDGYYPSIVLDNTPPGYALEKQGVPPPEWYLSPGPISFDGVDPNNPFNFPNYIPDPLDPLKPDIQPTFYYVGADGEARPGQPTLPGTFIPPSGFPGAPGAPPGGPVGGGGPGGGGPPVLPDGPNVDPIIIGDMRRVIGNVDPIVNNIEGMIEGQFNVTMDDASGITGKIPGKIDDQLTRVMGTVYGTGIGVGIPVPTVDDIIEGNVGLEFGFSNVEPQGGFTTNTFTTPTEVRPGIIEGFGIVGQGGFSGPVGGVMIPPNQPAVGIPPFGAGGQAVFPPVPFGFQPLPGAPMPPAGGGGGVGVVVGPIGPAQAGRPVPGGAFADPAPVAPLPPNFPIPGGGGGGVVGIPIAPMGGGGQGGFSSDNTITNYPPGYYPPGYVPPFSYDPFGVPFPVMPPIPPMQPIIGGGFTTINQPAPLPPMPPGAPVNVNIQGGSTTNISNVTSNVSNSGGPPAPSPAPSPAPEPEPEPAQEEIPAPAPLQINPIQLPAAAGNWEFGGACNVPINQVNFSTDDLFKVFGFSRKNKNELNPPAWLNPDNYPLGFQWVASSGMNILGNLINSANAIFMASIPITNNWSQFQALAIGGITEKLLGIPVLPFMQSNVYNINYQNPQLLPGIPDLQNLFRKDAISEETFRCLVRANGSYDSWQMKIAESSTLVPSLIDIIKLYRGKKIGGNEFEYYANLNGLKIGTAQGKIDIANFLEATRAIPGLPDLVRMMVRDAGDNAVAAKYGTDTDLDNKFAGKIEEWSEQQGVDPEIMKYYWRAHWEIPSNTQLFDMLHKLRPNRRVGNVPGNIATTAADIKQAIQVNDLTPFWVDRVMATSYHPLTRIDAQRAFFIDAISEDRLFDAYMDLGYDKDNAQALVDFSKELKKKRESNLPGADKPANILGQLKRYLINRQDATNRLIAIGMKKEKAEAAVYNTVRDRIAEAKAKCLKEAQRRFFRAEYDLIKYKQVVMSLGLPQENVEDLINESQCLYNSRGKELNAGALCKAFKQNIIAFDQFQNRLNLIGYDKDEAFIIAESCQIDKVVAIGKAKLAIEAKEKAAFEKAQKAELAARKEAERLAEKAKKAAEEAEKKRLKDNPKPP